MPVGLQVFDAAGNTILDTVTRTFRIIGSVVIPTSGPSTGSITIPGWDDQGTAFFFVQCNSPDLYDRPSVTKSGNVLSWTRSTVQATVFYGAF